MCAYGFLIFLNITVKTIYENPYITFSSLKANNSELYQTYKIKENKYKNSEICD